MLPVIKNLKNKNGFTLAEMIISVAIITFISIFIVQLFIVAKNLNQKAHDIDKAVYSTQSILEIIKSEQNPEQIKNSSFMDNALIKENGKVMEISFFFDEEWDVIKKAYNNLVEVNNKKVEFVIKTHISPILNENKRSKSYSITISTVKLNPYLLEHIKNKELYTIKATRYFNRIGEN